MAKSKLFCPVTHADETSIEDAKEKPDWFINPPVHAEVPRFSGDTDSAERPLSLKGDGQPTLLKVSKRGFLSRNGKIDY